MLILPGTVEVIAALVALFSIVAHLERVIGPMARGQQSAAVHRPRWISVVGLIAYTAAWLASLIGLWFFQWQIIYGSADGQIGGCWPNHNSSQRWTWVVLIGVFGVLGDLGVCCALARRSVNLLAVAAPFTLLMAFLFWLLWSVLHAIGVHPPSRC